MQFVNLLSVHATRGARPGMNDGVATPQQRHVSRSRHNLARGHPRDKCRNEGHAESRHGRARHIAAHPSGGLRAGLHVCANGQAQGGDRGHHSKPPMHFTYRHNRNSIFMHITNKQTPPQGHHTPAQPCKSFLPPQHQQQQAPFAQPSLQLPPPMHALRAETTVRAASRFKHSRRPPPSAAAAAPRRRRRCGSRPRRPRARHRAG